MNSQFDPSNLVESNGEIDLVDHLPESLKIMLELTDIGTVFALVSQFGGTSVTFPSPSRVTENDHLAKLIGTESLIKLAQYYNGDTIYFPQATHYLIALRDCQILKDTETMKNAVVARKHKISERWVRQIKSRGIVKHFVQDERQIGLFE